MNARIDNLFKSQVFYYSLIVLISTLSFFAYSPLFHPAFDSDHAIHVLMSTRNDYPNGLFYWGQNRLGSFLPEVTYYFNKITGIHPLISISIINHSFLITIFFILSTLLKKKLNRLFLAIVIFFPLYTFNALLLIGHPYCSQMVTGLIGIFLLSKAYQVLIKTESLIKVNIWLFTLVGIFFLGISIWVSEFSLLFLIFISLFLIFDRANHIVIWKIFKENKFFSILFILVIAVEFMLIYLKVQQYKAYFPENKLYDQVFLRDISEIKQQFSWMSDKLKNNFLFKEGWNTLSFFSWGILILFIQIIFSGNFKKYSPLLLSLFFSLIIGFIALFFSTWNYRSEFEPRYFTILYLGLMVMIFLAEENLVFFRGIFQKTTIALVFLFLVVNNYSHLIPRQPGVVERYGEFARLKPGGIIGNYWHCYRIAAVAPYDLYPIPKEGDACRNEFLIDYIMDSQTLFYVIKTDFYPDERELPDTLVQHGYYFVRISDEEKNIGGICFSEYWLVGNSKFL